MGGEFGPPVSLPPRALCSTSAAVPLPGATSLSAQERQLCLRRSVLLLVLPTYLVPRAPLCYILLSLGLSSPSFLRSTPVSSPVFPSYCRHHHHGCIIIVRPFLLI